MRIFALGDLHLSLGTDKPMDIFGENWVGHTGKIAQSWNSQVAVEDIVLIPGDTSWAMRLPETAADFAWLRQLPGRKVFIRGNHDYWWESLKKLNALNLPDFYFIHNNAVVLDGVAIAGTRLWNFPFVKWPQPLKENPALARRESPAEKNRGADDAKVCQSELNRLQMSLAQLPGTARLKIVMTHFPPVSMTPEENELTAQIAAAGAEICVFGHIHGLEVAPAAADCTISGVRYYLTAADYLNFNLKLIKEL